MKKVIESSENVQSIVLLTEAISWLKDGDKLSAYEAIQDALEVMGF